ncbi:MAG: VOC family protein [Candidatus Competibacteraceae bacterium]|nr:MAG: VOC family protein [Candidatus Competibacteraceae bacterium]
MNNPVGWFEIYVEDLGRAKAFYETVFDLQLSELENAEIEMLAFPMRPEGYSAPVALVRMPGFSVGANSVIIYFSYFYCGVEAIKTKNAGGQIHKEKISIGQYGFIVLIADMEGNMVGLHSMQ